VTQLLVFVLKRVALARLLAVQDGTVQITGTDALLATDVQIAPIMPANPDRVAVYFAPIRSDREQQTAEPVNTVVKETIVLEIRVRVYSPGEDDEDAATVELTLDAACNAVARALMDGSPLYALGSMNVSGVTQWPTAVQAAPDPGITGTASVIFTVELMTS
jgi:hypothetical protein